MLKKINLLLLRSVLFFLLWPIAVWAGHPHPDDRAYILMDAASGDILLNKNIDKRMPPASLTKLMTAYLVFSALDKQDIHLYDDVKISRSAYSMPGSRMFIEPGSLVSVEDLLLGMIVQSGNDAATALAEYVGGSVDEFVDMMNQRADELGLQNSHFVNPTGLPDKAHYTTAFDIAELSRRLINDFPEYYQYYSIREFTYNKIKQNNRNRLLSDEDVDGLKTGYTDEAGYCLSASAIQKDFRLITVVLGADTERKRFQIARSLLNKGFRDFVRVPVYSADQVLTRLKVYRASVNEISVSSAEDIFVTIPSGKAKDLSAKFKPSSILLAPVHRNDVVGKIEIYVQDKLLKTVDALSRDEAPLGGYFKVLWDDIQLKWKNR